MNATVGNGMALTPPTARDFDILRMSAVEWASTRAIAARHDISQTRVRQVIERTSAWLAQALPVQTELELEQQVRLAQHLAADQLRHQAQTLNNYWNGTGDPKYLRQQTRVIQALARLGVVPGRIEALAADVTEGPEPLNEPLPPEEDPFVNARHEPAGGAPVASPSEGACSPSENSAAKAPPEEANENGASDCGAEPSEPAAAAEPTELEGAQLMERRLLTLLDFCGPEDGERRGRLQETLAKVRREKAVMELRLSANRPGVKVATQPDRRDEKGAGLECRMVEH